MCTRVTDTRDGISMSKGSRRRRREVNTTIPSLTVSRHRPLSSPSVSLVSPLAQSYLQEAEDRRAYHPLGPSRPARFSTGGNSTITLRDKPSHDRFASVRRFASGTRAILAFGAPDRVALCVRRKSRREVMFAKRYAGLRGPKRHKPRRRWHSSISC